MRRLPRADSTMNIRIRRSIRIVKPCFFVDGAPYSLIKSLNLIHTHDLQAEPAGRWILTLIS